MKIAFLFLVISEINHENLWLKFFDKHESQYSVYIHSKLEFTQTSAFKKYEIAEKQPTTWANLMRAEKALLKEALKNPENEKFVFASESTIPIQSFDFVYETLMKHPHSQFDFWPNPHKGRKFPPLDPRKIYKNSQWVVLNRKHAQLIVNDTKIFEAMTSVPFDNEHYPSTFLLLNSLYDEIIKQNTTLDFWPKKGKKSHPHTFEQLTSDAHLNELIASITRKERLFARKFAKRCDLSPLKPYVSCI